MKACSRCSCRRWVSELIGGSDLPGNLVLRDTYPRDSLEPEPQDEFITTTDGKKHKVLAVTRLDEHHLVMRVEVRPGVETTLIRTSKQPDQDQPFQAP
jgi:hypothetical protein